MTSNDFKKVLTSLCRRRAPICLCIGSTKIMSDCFGPVCGYLLKEKYRVCAPVFGTLSSPVTALNLSLTLAVIRARYPLSPIVAVDSFVSASDDEELVFLPSPILPGKASGKTLPAVGNVSVIGCAAKYGQYQSLSSVFSLAERAAKTISEVIATLPSCAIGANVK